MNNRSIFISRKVLHPKLWSQIAKQGFSIHAESLIDFSPIVCQNIPDSDCLYFYSRNAVKFYNIQEHKNDDTVNQKVAAHGSQTAGAIKQYLDLEVDFIYDQEEPNPDLAFKAFTKDKSVLFIQAKNSLNTLQNCLAENQVMQLEVYENIAKKNFTIPSSKYLIFTSPLNVRTYFSKYDSLADQQLLAIGKTTGKECLQYVSASQVHISTESSERSLYKKLIELLN